MPKPTARLIRAKMDAYATEPSSQAANVKRIKGEKGLLRLRVGDWRVLFTDDGVVIAVLKVGPRSDVYEGV